MKAPSRHRPEACLSDFALDRRLAGELDEQEEREARAHLETCDRCAGRFGELARERDAFRAEPVPPAFETPSRRKASRARLVAATSVLAMAAAILLFVRFRPGDGTRPKGDAVRLGFYVKHGESVRLGGSGEHVAPGDALRFVYTARRTRHLAILSVDGARHATVYYPSGGAAAPAPPGDEVALPVSTVLDDALGEETIYGVFCPDAFAVEPLRLALEVSPDHAPLAPGCVVEKLTLRKDATSEDVIPSP